MKKSLLFALMVLSVSSAVMGQDYYWYGDQQIPLPQHGNQHYIIYSADSLQEADLEKIERCEDVSYTEYTNLKWGITKQNAVIEDTAHVFYQTLSYLTDSDHDMFVTHRFYVKLKVKEDLNILQNMANQYHAEIEREGAFQPWYILRCKLKSKYNALELANIFYESGLFSATEPEFIGAIEFLGLELNNEQISAKSKIIKDGKMFIKIGDKTYTSQGQETK